MPDEYLMLPFVLAGAVVLAFLLGAGAVVNSKRRGRRRRRPRRD